MSFLGENHRDTLKNSSVGFEVIAPMVRKAYKAVLSIGSKSKFRRIFSAPSSGSKNNPCKKPEHYCCSFLLFKNLTYILPNLTYILAFATRRQYGVVIKIAGIIGLKSACHLLLS
jgi:hypothetical protein